ncbi:hypothetical protein B0I37DRAFT_359388 [Chaetomium sp. MPI-CAGE-AT-0009]|nr:hypothetical protein B0I37DRAFT_359388 [Chaetomium sp. MPI-CAGE-AT-0009]
MAQNNSSVSANGTGRPSAARHKRRAAHRQVLKRSTSLETNSRLLFFGKSSAFPLSQSPSPRRPLFSSNRKIKPNQLAHPPVLHRRLSKPPAPSKLAKLYRRHRNLQRAVSLFLLRRQWWRRTRRPTLNMDFINHLRHIQADEPSSDEESGRILTFAAAPARRRTASPSKPPAAATPTQAGETEDVRAKRKRDTPAEAAPVTTSAETPRAAEKAAVPPPSPPANGKPSPVANGTKSPKKRVLAAEEAGSGARERVHKRAKTEAPLPPKPAAERSKAARATAPAPAPVPALAPVPAPAPAAAPLGSPSTRWSTLSGGSTTASTTPPSRRPATPPGALPSTGAARRRPRRPSALAVEAQKRAHGQRKGGERVQDLKGKGKVVVSPSLLHGKGVGKQPVVSKPDGGKRGERRWLSNARQTGANGGQRHPTSVKKYKKFA